MKTIKKFFVTIFLLFILPIIAKAFTSLEISTPNPPRGTEFYVQVNIDYILGDGKDYGIKDFHIKLLYNTEFFEYKSVTWLQGVNEVEIDKDNGIIYIDKPANNRQWSAKTSPIIIRFEAKKVGRSLIDLKANGTSHYANGDAIAQSFSGVTVNTVEPSTNTLIGTLSVDGYDLHPSFSKKTTEYYITVPAKVTSVNVKAKPSDDKQTIEGAGTAYLDYGENPIKIKVSAQNGSSRTYTITVTREDDRTGDTSLKSISVSDTSIQYVKGKTNYEATVSRSVDSVLISARTTDNRANMTGTGRKKLNIGKNTFQIIVTSSKNTKTVYTITINRSTEELEKVVKSSKLRLLRVNGIGLDLSNEKKYFLVGVKGDMIDLPLEAIGESNTATIEVTGDKQLKDGINKVTVNVKELLVAATEEEEAEYDETTYNIIAYKNPSNAELITKIDSIYTSKDIVFSTSENANHTIPESTINYLKNNKKTLYYNIVNIYNGLLYQAKINSNVSVNSIDASFKIKEAGTPEYHTSLPANTILTIYLGDFFEDETNVRIYSYTGEEKYKLVTDGILVKDGYIEFELNGDTEYIFTTASLIKEKGPFDKFMDEYGKMILAAVLIAIIGVIFVSIANKNKSKKSKKEPEY